MKLTFTERIDTLTEISYDKVISILLDGTSQKFQLFPNHIMYGHVGQGRINAVINPPIGWTDPFKSRVEGDIKKENEQTTLHLMIRPSRIVIVFAVIWCFLVILMTLSFNYIDFNESIQFLGLNLIWVLIPFGLGKIKVNWDKRRLEKWINKKMETMLNPAK